MFGIVFPSVLLCSRSSLKCWHLEKVSQLSQTGDPAHFRYYYCSSRKKNFGKTKLRKGFRIGTWTHVVQSEMGDCNLGHTSQECFKSYGQNTKLQVCNEFLESACLNICEEQAPHHDVCISWKSMIRVPYWLLSFQLGIFVGLFWQLGQRLRVNSWRRIPFHLLQSRGRPLQSPLAGEVEGGG